MNGEESKGNWSETDVKRRVRLLREAIRREKEGNEMKR